MYYIMGVTAGVVLPDENAANVAQSWFKSMLAVLILFYSALWSIKVSFLLFFRRLGKNVQGQKRIWWPVFGITLATYFACIGTIQYACLVSSLEYLTAHCATPAATSFQQITLKLNCAWDVITDCLIMLVPFSMLRGVQMRWRRKAALTAIFSLVVITMVVAVLRAALVGSNQAASPDSSWLYMWSAIEASIAIIVACLASFRNLFSRESNRPRATPPAAPTSSNLFLRGSGKRKKMRDILDSLASMPDAGHTGYRQQSEATSDTQSIMIRHDDSAHDLGEIAKAV
ncbi:MAG: hypothetical protein LQ348_001478 [Seirophora lacunosa]|nr:MAG: hypothetical protein LQ348_001478 [Seirophora lacunosa]